MRPCVSIGNNIIVFVSVKCAEGFLVLVQMTECGLAEHKIAIGLPL
jgi:hypothetical protein